MKYALLQKSVFSHSRVISDSFLTSFWSFWPPQIGLNRLLEAPLDCSDFRLIIGLHFFYFLIILPLSRRSQGILKFCNRTLFEPCWLIWSPCRAQMPLWRWFLLIRVVCLIVSSMFSCDFWTNTEWISFFLYSISKAVRIFWVFDAGVWWNSD